jgi:hypothetical protein
MSIQFHMEMVAECDIPLWIGEGVVTPLEGFVGVGVGVSVGLAEAIDEVVEGSSGGIPQFCSIQ